MQIYINKSGCSVKVKGGQLVIKQPEGEEQTVPMQTVKALFLHKSAHLSAAVVFAAAQHDIDLQFVGRNGSPVARIWTNRFGSISRVRKGQLSFSMDAKAIAWVKGILQEKIDNQIALLLSVQTLDDYAITKPAIDKMEDYKARIEKMDCTDMGEAGKKIRPMEAAASKLYFEVLNVLLPHQYRFEKRSQHPAMDMFNGLLNYAYGILYGRIEGALIRAGIDPSIGVFHRDEYNRPVLVYDAIERFRCWADYVVVKLCQQEVVFIEFFAVENGAFYLNNHGKRILIQAMTDYLDEVVAYDGLDRSRQTHIDIQAQKWATMFKDFS